MDFDDESPRREESRPRKPRGFLFFLVLIFLAVMMFVWGRTAIGGAGKVAEVSIEEYVELKENGKVRSVRIVGDDLEEGGATHAAHPQVEHDGVGPPALELEQRLLPVARGAGAVPRLLQGEFHQRARVGIVVHHQDVARRAAEQRVERGRHRLPRERRLQRQRPARERRARRIHERHRRLPRGARGLEQREPRRHVAAVGEVGDDEHRAGERRRVGQPGRAERCRGDCRYR